MNFDFTPEQLEMQKEFREFVEKEIRPYARENDLKENMPPELLKKVAEKGYLGSMLPVEYAGMGLDQITIGILNQEVGSSCSSVRSLLTVHGMLALAILKWGTDKQRNFWLPKLSSGEAIGAFALTEPDVGSDAKSIETTAVLDGDYYVLNGQKKWITMGQIADVFLLFARCDDKPTAFLVESKSPGFSTKPIKGLIGARASMIAELFLENCRIPVNNIVGNVGMGLSHVALSSLDYGRYTIAHGCVGLAKSCLEDSVSYARKRKQFGQAIRENQLIQKMITEMTVNIKAAELLCYNAGYLKEEGDPESIMQTWVAKYFASKMLNQVTGDALQIHGANGCQNEYPIERYYRDAKINEIIEGTSQMHEVMIAINTIRTTRSTHSGGNKRA